MSKASVTRIQRRGKQPQSNADKVAKEAAPAAPVDPQQQATPQQQAQDPFVARVNDLVQGKVPCPNKYVGYLVDSIRSTQAEYDAAMQQMQNLQQQMQQMQAVCARLEGRLGGLGQDLKAWDKPDATEAERKAAG